MSELVLSGIAVSVRVPVTVVMSVLLSAVRLLFLLFLLFLL